jgi:hypothetical protein
MTAEQKSRLAQGLFFGLLFVYLGYFMKGCAGEYESVKSSGKIGMVMGAVIVGWGIRQALARPK